MNIQISRELAERVLSCAWSVADPAMKELRALLAAPVVELAALREELASAKADKEAYAQNAIDLRKRLTAAEQRNVELTPLIAMAKELLSTISLHQTTAPKDWCESFKGEVSRRISTLGDALKPTESGASE